MRKFLVFFIIFLISAVTLIAQSITELENLVEAGDLSQEKVIEMAREMGYTDEEIQKALEKKDSGGTGRRDDELREAIERRRRVLEEKEKRSAALKAKEESLVLKKQKVHPFGYDIFNIVPQTFEPLDIGPADPDYPVSPGDEVIIRLWGEVNTSYELFVDREGKIFIPDVGRVIVNGLTLEQLKGKVKSRLAAAYSGIRENKTFTDISLGKLQKVKVFIVGEVVRPGGYTVSSVSTVLNALYYAGGPTPKGSLRNVKLLSQNQLEEVIDLYDYLLSGERKNDKRIQNNHTIFVPPMGKQVTLRGRVHRPAIYELKDDEGIKELLEISGGLKYDAYKDRVQISRISEDTRKEVISVNLKEIQKTGTHNFILEDGDEVEVFSLLDREGCDSVYIYGEVGEPGSFELSVGMNLKNLILTSGGLTLPVYKLHAEVSRLIPGVKADSSEIISLDLEEVYSRTENENIVFELKDQDIVFLRIKPQWSEQRRVTIQGEIEEPGDYPIISENERLSHLIARAGGLKKTAYPEAAKFVRNESDIGRIDVDVVEALSNPNSEVDIILEDRDEIFIPRGLESVKVTGEVLFPVSFRFEPGKNVSYYIAKAGGCTQDANKKGIRLILPNGRGKNPESFLWFDVSSVPAGSEVVVPRAKDTSGINWGDIIKNVSSIVSSAVMVIFVVDRLND